MKYNIFGESHGEEIGVVIEGVPAGIELNLDFIKSEMARRAPGKSRFSTKRRESDAVRIVSGVFNGYTTGAPVCGLIENKDQNSGIYEKLKNVPRPGHADYTASVKYGGFQDYRGGGHFSGRLTAPIVFAGALAKLSLACRGVEIISRVHSIGNVADRSEDWLGAAPEQFEFLRGMEIPVLEEVTGILMAETIIHAGQEGDSVGGVIECVVFGLPAGVGKPGLESLESLISGHVFAVPGVKGIEFGSGFAMTGLRGSQVNDDFYFDGAGIKTQTNNNGGVNGGIANGMPLIFRAAVKPTPSISHAQYSVNLDSLEHVRIEIQGRHDPCIVPRAVAVLEAAAALALSQADGI